MAGLTCNACNKELADEVEQRIHYKSEWHRYNLKRKVAGVPGVTEVLFQARQSALADEKGKLDQAPMLYACGICGKEYKSSKAHAQHLKSNTHLMRVSEATSSDDTIIRPVPSRAAKEEDEESGDDSEWEEVEDYDHGVEDMSEDGEGLTGVDPRSCFMCDTDHDTVEGCMVHMLKNHGLFIPDTEYLKDPEGLLTYLSLKVKRDFLCLYCQETSHAFGSLEAVRKHMEAKSHCRVHYGDGTEDDEADLEEFYDYSSSYADDASDGKQLAGPTTDSSVELGADGAELIITRTTDKGTKLTRVFGSREYLRYYRQKPRPTAVNRYGAAVLASRYRSMGLETVQSRENAIRMKAMKAMNRSGVEFMRSKIGMKSNVIRNLPQNVPY
ncbi:hypothetical protein M569_02614 [Genlisea aurea]|uniref:C2H2-type domain-containing protein n=1 Tax=Genlisea aurea TaxID=192259 RepID=S8EHG0_9LAMI|nr:hypothetical protein M569_02614 [Genlisea aurea]